MLDKITKIFKTSLIYGLSNMFAKAAGVLLLPIHLQYFTVEEYGRLGLMLISAMFISSVLISGQNQAIIRFSNIPEYVSRRKSYFFSVFFVIGLWSILLVAILLFFQEALASLFPQPENYREPIKLTAYLTGIMMLNNVLTNKLRADENPVMFFWGGFVKLLGIIGGTVWFVIYAGWNIEGVLLATIIGEVAAFFVMLPPIIKAIRIKFESELLKESFKFGLPLIFSVIALNFLVGIDRYIIQYLTDEYQLGLYELAYRITGTINMFVVMPLNLTIFPVAYKIYKKDNDRYYYSKMMTFAMILMVLPTLAVALFGQEIVWIFDRSTNYYEAAEIVPYLASSYVFVGMTIIAALGMYLTGKTKTVAVVNFLVSLLNVVLNFALIPVIGVKGAAVATVISYIVLYKVSYLYSRKFYGFSFEFRKIYSLLAFTVLLYFIGILPGFENIYLNTIYKSGIIIFLPISLFFTGYFAPHEKEAILKILKSLKSPADLVNLVKGFISGDINIK